MGLEKNSLKLETTNSSDNFLEALIWHTMSNIYLSFYLVYSHQMQFASNQQIK